MREHVRLSREKQRVVVGAELAAALDKPVTRLNARQPQSYRLAPGRHMLLPHVGRQIPFTVTDSWTVDYDRRFDSILSGRAPRP